MGLAEGIWAVYHSISYNRAKIDRLYLNYALIKEMEMCIKRQRKSLH